MDLREEWIRKMTESREELGRVNLALLAASEKFEDANDGLKDAESELLMEVDDSGKPFIKGSSQDKRAGELRWHTEGRREKMKKAKRELNAMKVEYENCREKMLECRAIVRLMSRDDD